MGIYIDPFKHCGGAKTNKQHVGASRVVVSFSTIVDEFDGRNRTNLDGSVFV